MRRALAVALGLAVATADATAGGDVFAARCASCHALVAGAAVAAGPNLAGVLGRRVAGDAAFDYSPVLRAAGAAGRVWDGDALARFLADPEAMFPGIWMGANGLQRADDIAAVVAHLASPARR